MTHIAAQYLAAAGISFLKAEKDDSHTNLQFVVGNRSLHSRPLSENGDTISFNYDTYALEWHSVKGSNSISLEGKRHDEVLKWISKMVVWSGLKKNFHYKFHYEAPYKITDNFQFAVNWEKLGELSRIRVLAQNVVESFIIRQNLDSEVRVWPHHFDTGAYSLIDNNPKLAVGLGLAIPDTLCQEFYFYISVYDGHISMDTSNLLPLNHGIWKNNGFKGAILPASETTAVQVEQFFDQALNMYKLAYAQEI